MVRILDERMVDEIEVGRIDLKHNVRRTEGEIPEEVITYVVQVTIVYWLLDGYGNRLKRVVRRHDISPLANPITSVQFINNLATLAPLIRAAALADREDFTVTP